jgi:diguanylate cyclase (GGDEF)-like protein/PAS domain S-box-containing protein
MRVLGAYMPLIGGTVLGVSALVVVAFLQRSKLRAEKLVGLLHGSEQRFRTLAASSPVGIFQLDSEGRCVYANARFRTILGVSGALEPGWREAVHPDDRANADAAWKGAAHGKTVPPLRFRIGEGNGLRWAEARAATLRDDHGAIVGCVGTIEDITERERIEAQLTHQALHDPITGLPNRTLFLDRVGMALARTRRAGGETAVLFIDLDRFKLINDSLGHEAGDRLLNTVAARLDNAMRESDSVGRLGGDEFAVLCEVKEPEEAVMIAERIAAAIEAPVELSTGQTSVVSASIGIALGSGSSTPAGLLENADAAMYRAKEQGKARVETYDESMRARTLRRLQVESALRAAIEKEQMLVFYQAAVGLAEGEITGAEALVRWRDPERGLVSPGEFIPVAEETGMIVPLGAWVLREACRAAARLRRPGRSFKMAVNLSTRQLVQPGLVQLVADTLEETGLEPASLCLEITETALMQDTDRAVVLLEELKALGITLSLDDFGTGYSSLSYLRRFPVDEVKVDRSFVDGLVDRPGDASIVAAVRDVTRTLGLDLVAEGIETKEQLDRLRALGYENGQGFLFARPGPFEGLEELLRMGAPWLSRDLFSGPPEHTMALA